MGRTDGNQTFGGSVPVCSSGVLHSVFAKSLSYSEEKRNRSLFAAMKRLLGFCCSDRFEHLVDCETITKFALQVQLLKVNPSMCLWTSLILLFLFYTVTVDAFRSGGRELFPLQTEFEKRGSLSMALTYILTSSEGIVTHSCLCKNAISERFCRIFQVVQYMLLHSVQV